MSGGYHRKLPVCFTRTNKPRKTSQGSAEEFFPDKLTLPALKEAAADCKACDLWKRGTQTVFGEGRKRSTVIFVGEQPGNEEDLMGKPFVGPAGRLFDNALVEAGIDALVITGPENIFYLTGQQTPGYYTFQALLLPAEGHPVFVIRQLEYFNFIANTFITNAEVYQDGDQPVNFLVNVIKARNWTSKRIAIDKRGWFLPIATYEALVREHANMGGFPANRVSEVMEVIDPTTAE